MCKRRQVLGFLAFTLRILGDLMLTINVSHILILKRIVFKLVTDTSFARKTPKNESDFSSKSSDKCPSSGNFISEFQLLHLYIENTSLPGILVSLKSKKRLYDDGLRIRKPCVHVEWTAVLRVLLSICYWYLVFFGMFAAVISINFCGSDTQCGGHTENTSTWVIGLMTALRRTVCTSENQEWQCKAYCVFGSVEEVPQAHWSTISHPWSLSELKGWLIT